LVKEPSNPEKVIKKESFLEAIKPSLTPEQLMELEATLNTSKQVPKHRLVTL